MKKLFFTLSICLFSLGAFASNGNLLNEVELLPTKGITSIENVVMKSKCTTTVTITIDHGPNFPPEIITIVIVGPCD